MSFLLILMGLGVIYYVFVDQYGNLDFWKIVAKFPNEAWDFFSQNENWFIGSPPNIKGYQGPFMLENPSKQKWVKVYCISEAALVKTQNEFIGLVTKKQ